MSEAKHTILCVDDEINILHSLKRLLRKEGYRLLTASSAKEAFEILSENSVQLIISDQRMPETSGTELLAQVKEKYPNAIRVILTGYTDVDSITESINKGHIYKFFLKPWNDHNLKLEIRQALEQYDLIEANRQLDQTVLRQNEELKKINENLESMVQARTRELNLRNKALELSHAILEDLPLPIVGISSDAMIVLLNQKAQRLTNGGQPFMVGNKIEAYFEKEVMEKIHNSLIDEKLVSLKNYLIGNQRFEVELIPLSGRFRGRGLIMTFKPDPDSAQ